MRTQPPAGASPAAPRLRRAPDERSPRRLLAVLGRRVALLGDERGVFEAWVWPLKVLRSLEPCFVSPDGQVTRGRDAVAEVEVAPHEVVLRYGGDGWSADLTLFAALAERAVVGLVRVEATRPLELRLEVAPEMRPMWPAGLGGQIAHPDEPSGAFLLTEELGRFAALLGSPEAEPVRAAGDHALPREDVGLRIPITARRARKGPVPFFLVGAEVEPEPLGEAARLGLDEASRGHARSRRVVEQARALYREAGRAWPRWREQLVEHWRGFRTRTARVSTPDPRFDRAFEAAAITIERSWVEVDGLGRGLVAGLARSGVGERPGFGWFFDGDALVAARAQTGIGDFAGAREVLRFAASHQREDGKLMHELTLSARLCDWVGDYPYAYYKAGNTPAFLAVLEHYVAGSGDLALARELWPNALAAFECCLRWVDDDGLISVRKGGLAAVEAGALVGRLRAEVYLQGIWISAAKGLRALATRLGESDVEARARAAAERAEAAFELFWSEERGRYGFGRLVDGGLCDDLTAYLGLPLGRGFGDPERALASAQALNHPALAADWGPRMFATGSATYDPADYNTGSVFPYLANHAILAQYRHGLTASAWQMFASQVALSGFDAVGCVPEHLLGDRCETPARGVPHQVFSSATILQSTLYGLFGLAGDATEGVLVVRAALPAHWKQAELQGFRLGGRVIDLVLMRAGSGIFLGATLREGPPLKLFFQPPLPLLSRDVVERLGDRAHPVSLERRGAALVPRGAGLELSGRGVVLFEGRLGPTPWLGVSTELEPGAPPRDVRLAGVRACDDAVTWSFWGRAGSTARVPFRSDLVLDVRGARLDASDALLLAFPPGEGFTRVDVTLEVRA